MKEKGMTTINLKKFNRNKVYQYIYQQKETSKLQIVRDLQMGLSTVSQNLNELEQDGLICRNGYFDIVAVNLYGEVMATETIELPYVNSDTYYTSLAENVETFILNRQYEPEKIEGISIATQGIISPDGTAVIYGDIMGNTQMKLSDFSSRLP